MYAVNEYIDFKILTEEINMNAEFLKDFVSTNREATLELKRNYHPDINPKSKIPGTKEYYITLMLTHYINGDESSFRKLMREYRVKFGGPKFKSETPEERAATWGKRRSNGWYNAGGGSYDSNDAEFELRLSKTAKNLLIAGFAASAVAVIIVKMRERYRKKQIEKELEKDEEYGYR